MNVIHNEGDSTFSLEVNGKDFEDDAPITFELYLVAELTEYLEYVSTVSFRFTVLVKDPCRTSSLSGSLEIEALVV